MQFLISKVNTKLFKTIKYEIFKPKNIGFISLAGIIVKFNLLTIQLNNLSYNDLVKESLAAIPVFLFLYTLFNFK